MTVALRTANKTINCACPGAKVSGQIWQFLELDTTATPSNTFKRESK